MGSYWKQLLWGGVAWGLGACASQQSLVSVDLSECALAPSVANVPVGATGATVNLLARFQGAPVQDTRVVWSASGCDMLPASTQTDSVGNGQSVAHCNNPRQSLLSAALAVSGQSLALPGTPALKFYSPADGNVAISVGTPMNLLAAARTAAGALDPSYRGRVHVSSSDPNASLPQDYTFVAADHGVKVWPDAVVLRSAGVQSVTVQDSATHAVLHRETFEIVSTGVTQLRVQTAPNPMAGVAQDVTVSALDSTGAVNPFYLGSIVFSSSDANATLPLSTTFTASNAGVLTLPASLVWKTSGAHSLGAQDAAVGVGGAANVTVGDAGADHLDLTVASAVLAGVAQAAQVHVLDAYDNPATSYRGTLHFTSSDSAATLPPDIALGAADAGSYAWPSALVWRSTGAQALTVTDSQRPSLSVQRIVAVSPVTATHLQVSSGPATAGVPLAVTVTALDDSGQVATHYNGTVALSNSDAQGTNGGSYTYQSADGGTHVFATGVTLRTAGTATVHASDLAGLNGSASAQVAAAAAAQLQLTGLPSGATAGVPLTATITALDAFGNTAITYAGTVHLTSIDAAAVLPADFTFTPPQAAQNTTLVLKTAGNASVLAADTSNTLALGSANVSVQAAAAASINFTWLPGSPLPVNQALCVAYALSDAYGNRATGYRGTVTFTSSDANAVLPAPHTLTSNEAGGVTDCTLQLGSYGGQTWTVTDNSNPPLSATSDKRYAAHACTNYGSAGSVSDSRYGQSFNPSMALDANGYPVIAWEDYSPGTAQVFVRRWDGSSWADMAGSGSASGISSNANNNQGVSLILGPTGLPIAAWQASGMAIFSMGYSGSAWAPLSTQGDSSPGITGNNTFSQYTASLALASDGRPMVAYVGQPSGQSDVYVLKFDGTHWAPLSGGANVSQMPGYATRPTLVSNSAGTPYVAWQAANASTGNNEIYVATYSGGAWVGLGGSQNGNGISNNPGDSVEPALALSPNGLPMVAWTDNTSGNYEIYVRTWNGSAWLAPAGSASGGGISNNPSSSVQPDIASDANGRPVVTWQDEPGASSYGRFRIYLRRFDGTAWQEMFGSATDLGTNLGADNSNIDVAQHMRLTPSGSPVITWVSDFNYSYAMEQVHACVWQ